MPCGLPLAVHRHASIAGVMLTRRGAFLWLLWRRGLQRAARCAEDPHAWVLHLQPFIATKRALFTRRETSCLTSAAFTSLLSLHIDGGDPVTAGSTQRLRAR